MHESPYLLIGATVDVQLSNGRICRGVLTEYDRWLTKDNAEEGKPFDPWFYVKIDTGLRHRPFSKMKVVEHPKHKCAAYETRNVEGKLYS